MIADLHRQAVSAVWNDPVEVCIAALRAECSGVLPGEARLACERLRRIRYRAADLAACVSVDQPVLRQWTFALVRQTAQAHQHLSRLAFWTRFGPPESGLPAESSQRPWPPGSIAAGKTVGRTAMTLAPVLFLPSGGL